MHILMHITKKITSNPYANKQLPHAPKHLKTKKISPLPSLQ